MPEYITNDARWPNLDQSNHEVTSRCDRRYNCAAWVVGITSAPWWPDQDHPWFVEVAFEDEDTLKAMIAGYRAEGFEVCGDDDFNPEYEKIVIYVSSSGSPQHVALQLADGQWTSKLGECQDIRHATERALVGGTSGYGYPHTYMRRRRDAE